MNRYERITRMEAILDHHQSLIDQLRPLLESFSKNQKEFRKLVNYYGSEPYYKDRDASNKPSFPADFKCGVLSEDAVYNLLMDNRQMALQMIAAALDVLENK